MAEGGGEGQTADAHPGTHDVFISYASHDTAVADNVAAALEGQGLKCWIAPRDVTPGAHYASEIVHAIDSAKAMVLVLSQDAATSPHVLREIERATSKRHPVVTLRLDQAPLPAEFEYFLNTSQWLHASGADTPRAMPKLVSAVRLAIQPAVVPPASTPTAHTAAASTYTPPANRTVIVVVSVVGLAIAGLAANRLWLSSRRAASTPAPTVPASAAMSAPAELKIPEKSVAVLPFVDMSEKKDQEYFSDGLSEELIDMLTKVPDLRVPARTSSFYFKGKQTTIADIAKALSVSHVLEGSVRKSGNKLRVTAQLIRVDNGYHVWSETYDRKLDDIFKVQDEIAAAVVTALKVSLLGGGVPRATPTMSTDAYTLYLQAQSIRNHALQSADAERAIDYLQRALKLDPKFARAWAALANYRVLNYGYYTSGNYRQVVAEARFAAEQALKLDPNLPDAHDAMGNVYELEWNWKAMEVEVDRVFALDPGSATALWDVSGFRLTEGRFEEAVNLAQKAVALDPLVADNYASLAMAYLASGRFIEAEAAYRQALDLAPTGSQLHFLLGWALLARREPAAALAEMEQESDERYRDVGLALALDALGRKSDADRALAAAEAKYAKVVEYPIAVVYTNRNDLDKAFAWLDRAYQVHDGWVPWLPWDPLMKNLRDDPRYKALLQKMNLPLE